MVDSKFELVSVCSWSMELAGRVPIGETPEGMRAVGYLKEGSVTGTRISGTVMAGTADWTVVRRDGILRPDVKLIIHTHDDATIFVEYDGFVDLGPDGYSAGLGSGAILHPRTLIRMLSASPAYAWVNRSPFIGIGHLDMGKGLGVISYDIYEVTAPPFNS